MKVGINCLSIKSSYTGGIKTYTNGLLDGFARLPATAQFTIYVTKHNEHLFDHLLAYPNFSVRVVDGYDSLFKRYALWRLAMMKAKSWYKVMADLCYSKISKQLSSENDLLYFPNTVINPFNYKKPTVLSMHDIQQVHFPEFFDAQQLADRYVNYNLSAENVSYMQASSEFIRRDFLDYFTCLREDQVEVIQEGVDLATFRAERPLAELIRKYAIPEAYILFPAQLWHHKNHLTVLKALKSLHDKGRTIPLVMTGAQFSATQQIFDFIRENRMDYVYYLGKVPFDELTGLYQAARFMITAVLYESSSLPVLEAAASGTPVIASSTPPNIELGQKLKINLFDPKRPDELEALLAKIWDDAALQKEQVAWNTTHIEAYSWTNVAARYLRFFERILQTPTHQL